MRRSRSVTLLPLALVLAAAAIARLLAGPASAAAASAPEVSSPELAYVLTTGGIRANLTARLHLTPAQDAQLREYGWQLYWEQRKIARRSDLVVMNGALSAEEKRRIIAETGYNQKMHAAEALTAGRIASALGLPEAQLATAVDEVWRQDAAEHALEAELDALGVTPQAITGRFRVYATRFEYQEGVAVPDAYVKFASLGWKVSRPAGYPAETNPPSRYGLSLYWDGIQHGRDGSGNTQVAPAKTLPFVRVTDVGPWNTDDNWWNSYSDPQRPRRTNSKVIYSGKQNYLAGRPHLAYGMPEAQFAYFNNTDRYYGTPNPRPAGTWNPDGTPLNYWGSPSGGTWRGVDQFGRQVMNPAGIDLGHVPYAQLGLKDNEWIEVVPLWEAPLVMNSSFLVTPGPYLTGQVVKFAFNVKNAGTLPGTWERAAIRLTVGDKLINPPDQGPFTLAPGQSRTFTFTKELAEPGTVSAKAMVRRGGVWATIDGTERFAAPVASFTVAKRSFGRVAGADRYRTAVNVSRKLFPGTAPVVVIASGQNFPDALAGAALARAEDAPLLLTPLASLPTAVHDEIVRLRPARVVILGGTKVVSWQVQKDIGALVGGTGNTSRIFGWNRYATARLVAEAIAAKTGGKVKDNTVVVATGRDFPDALAGAVLSAEEAWPVLLTEPSRLPTDTAAAIAKLGVRRTIVLGGAGVVSDDVEDALPGPVRIAGADRYDTAARVARWAESAGSLSFRYVGLATGLDFPDALAGGTLAADRGGMLLLTRPTALADPTRRLLVEHRTVTATLDAYGSTGVIPDAVFRQAREALH